MKKKHFRFLSLAFFLIGIFFLLNSKTDITGAVVGVSNISSGFSSIFGIVFILVSAMLFVGGESLEERLEDEHHWKKYPLNKDSIIQDVEQEYLNSQEEYKRSPIQERIERMVAGGKTIDAPNKKRYYEEQFYEGHASQGGRVIDVQSHLAKEGEKKGRLIHFGRPANARYLWVVDEDGNFIVDSLITISNKTYELNISKDEYGGYLDDYFDGLSAVDASRIARHAANLYNFDDPNEKIAANVIIDYRCEDEYGNPMGTYDEEGECLTLCNKDDCEQAVENYDWVPNIEAGDASRVARYAAGIIEDLDDQCDPHWVFRNPDNEIMVDTTNCNSLPNSSNFVRNYKIEGLMSDATFIFEGIRLGDVTGNWTAPLGRENDENIVENPTVELEVGQIVKLPLYLPNKVEVEGLDLTIQYDPEVFTLIGFNNNNSILDKSKYPTIINTEKTGLFTLVSYANSTPINDNGLLGHIKFKVIGNSTPWSSISINEMKINDIQEGGFLVEGNFESSSIAYGFDFQISAVPEVFALNKNYPNPFNPSTNINFELPNDGDVRIFIYDLKGSLVDELVNGYMEAGYYNLKWDGSRKASGVYFIQMIADNGNYIKMAKMMLVK